MKPLSLFHRSTLLVTYTGVVSHHTTSLHDINLKQLDYTLLILLLLLPIF